MQENIIDNNVVVNEYEPDVTPIETFDVIEVSEIEPIEIETLSAFAPLGEPNTQLRHTLLNDKDLPDQHPIVSITGLRDELDSIEALSIVYSNEKNHADYYLWEDENPDQENRCGYFITVCNDTKKIRICDDNDEILGVTVDNAAFIGGQDNIQRDHKYGLVVRTGVVYVKCELDIEVNDFVISNRHGIAKKTNKNYGCKVIAKHNIEGVMHAIISLGISPNQIDLIADEMAHINLRIDDNETNTITAINVANEAYNKAQRAEILGSGASQKADEAFKKSDQATSQVGEAITQVESANQVATKAQEIANSAIISAESIRQEAVKTANEALSDVNKLIEDLEPINTWIDPTTGNIGAEYLTEYIKNGLATKTEVQAAETLTENLKNTVNSNAGEFERFVSSVDKYSVGEWSQAYGLTKEQASNILKIGMIYIPTVNHSEMYDETEYRFTRTYYYVWNGTIWVESLSPYVAFSQYAPVANDKIQYWYTETDEVEEGYETYTLYAWLDKKWTKVNILDGNVTNRVVSMIRQTSNEINIEVAGARGDVATLRQKVDENGSSIALVVSEKDGNKVIDAASIVTSINNGDSSIVLNSDHISLAGKTINLTSDDIIINSTNFSVTKDGVVTAKSGHIGGWNLLKYRLESDLTASGGYRTGIQCGTELTNAAFYAGTTTPSGGAIASASASAFFVRNDGYLHASKANIQGKIIADSGSIGRWNVLTSGADGLLYAENGDNRMVLKTKADVALSIGTPVTNDIWTTTGAVFQVFHSGKVRMGLLGLNTGNKDSHYAMVVDELGFVYINDAIDINGVCYMNNTLNANSTLNANGILNANGHLDFHKRIFNELYDSSGKRYRVIISSPEYFSNTSDGFNGNDKIFFSEFADVVKFYITADGDVWHTTSNTITGSDERIKTDITPLSDKYSEIFDNLIPVSYKYKDGSSGRTHTGFKAQDVLKAIEKAGLTTQDFAAFVRDKTDSEDILGGYILALRYTEFIALLVNEVQKLKTKVQNLEKELNPQE